MLIQQGDVLLKRIEKLPSGLKPAKRKERGYILADGEVTGHAHVIDELDTVFVAEDGTLYVETDIPVTVKHEEHKTVTLDPGIYRVDRVKEIDPFTKEISNVKD